jgi:lipopolysaccharide export system protein LptA
MMHQLSLSTRRPLARLALVWGIGGFALTAALVGGMNLAAQGIAAHDSRAPVTYDAGNGVLDDRANRVVLSGGVTVTQAGLTLQSNRLLIDFTDAGQLEIQRITATGGVVITPRDVPDFARAIIKQYARIV